MAKTKAQITGVDKVKKDLSTFVTTAIKDEKLLKIIAELAREQIVKQTRSRTGEYKQKDIKKSTKERRATLIKQGNKSEFAEPKRSNLTLSGQLLDSLTFKVSAAQTLITLFFKENRKPYKGKKGQDLENKTNKEIAEDLDQRGFKFLFISERLKAQLQSKIRTYLRERLANFKRIKRSLE